MPTTTTEARRTQRSGLCALCVSVVQSVPAIVLIAIAFRSIPAAADEPLHKLVDQHINARLDKQQIPVAERASDAEFLRRVTLDLTGVVPDAKTARAFIEDKSADKRVRLIDRLLASDEYSKHMAVVFDVMLMERRPDKYVTTLEWRDWLAESFADDKPLNVLTAEILGADGVEDEKRPAARFYLDRAVDKDTLVRDIGRLFLGMNLQCAQCHDHPDIDDYRHQYYHGLSVFVAGSKTFRQPDGRFVLQETVLREVEFASVFDPDKTKKTGPRLIEALLTVPEFSEGEEYVEKPSRTVRSVPKFSLRELLSKKLPSNETPEFGRNMANRLWAMMMGRGLVHPLDMHHAGNPPSHPELMQSLTHRLSSSGYRVRSFLREIALSDAYQRSSLVPGGVNPDDIPLDSYAVAGMKGLSPEQLFESLLVATQSNPVLEWQIANALAEEGASAEADADDETKKNQAAEARRQKRAERLAEFVTVFGSVPGQPEGEFTSSLPQALFLANNETVSGWVPPGLGNLAERLVTLGDPNAIADELYLSTLSRFPDAEERRLVAEYLGESEDRPKAITALVWSQLASAEFRLNH